MSPVETCLDIYAKRDYISCKPSQALKLNKENGCDADLKRYCEQSILQHVRDLD